MKLTNKEILEAKVAVDKLLSEKLPVKISWGLAKMGSKLNGVVACIDPVRQGLFTAYQIYTEPIEGTNQVNILSNGDGENVPKFMEELNTLMQQEADLDCGETVTIPLEVGGKALEIEGATLLALEKLIKVE